MQQSLKITLIEINVLPKNELQPLLKESQSLGFSFVKRFVDNWENGNNRFDKPGELYLGAYIEGKLVGSGGVNIDPYLGDPQVGRLRHLYVLRDYRRLGVARKIVEQIIQHSREHFRVLRLRSNDKDGSGGSFYEALHFNLVDHETASHELVL